MVRLVVLVVFLALSAQAELVFWSPVGQNLTYILPDGISPQKYIEIVKTSQALAPFAANLLLSKNDSIEMVKTDPQSANGRVLLIANKVEDHGPQHIRINNFGRHLSRTFVLPVGSAFKLNYQDEEKFYRELGEHFGLFVFMGGDDKDPGLYGEKKTWSENTNVLRDFLEQRIIRSVYYKTSRKIFGVCRGLQQVFTALGGKLNQDIKNDLSVGEQHRGGTLHPIVLAETENGILSRIIKDLPQNYVDSHHHQSAREDSVNGTVFQVSARSPEGVIEALESRDARIFLVQFHPEMNDNVAQYTHGFFERLLGWMTVPSPVHCRKLF